MRTLNQNRLLVKVARLYFEQDLTQAQIADRLRLTRQKVQRMLVQARETGVVQIRISPMMGLHPHLEKILEHRFDLVEAIVVETTDYTDQGTVARELGVAGAEYLLRAVRPRDRIVFSWGNSLLALVNALLYPARVHAEELQVIQALGGLGDPNHEIHATQLVRNAARALGAQAILLPAPAVAGSAVACRAFYSDPYVCRVLETARTANLAFVGIGSSDAESILVPEFWNIMTPSMLATLKGRGAVGSINLRYFDRHGRAVASELDRLIVGLTLDELKQIHRVVGIAGGSTKLRAIEAALRAKLINVLITDHISAGRLAEEGKGAGTVRPRMMQTAKDGGRGGPPADM
ncbi:MAG: sugar-binding transcriptional regulator [Bryobacterales bacterium]|nr:sugar-binding transcriptional regulator [Bryobacterales bacterium]